MMFGQSGPMKVFVATRPVDFRKGIDGLSLAVQEMFGMDPFCGAAFRASKAHTGMRREIPTSEAREYGERRSLTFVGNSL